MGIRSFAIKNPRRGSSPWPARLVWVVIGAVVLVFVVVAARNLRQQDVLTQWRRSLEAASGYPAWPEWSSSWPALPVPRQRRHQLPQDLHGVYAYAATHREILQYIPCYCACVGEGHGSNWNCFVKGFRADGTPIWTDHSFNCEMCVHIAREAMLMSSQGMSVSTIRAAIDERYGHGHRPTNTPLPSHATNARQ